MVGLLGGSKYGRSQRDDTGMPPVAGTLESPGHADRHVWAEANDEENENPDGGLAASMLVALLAGQAFAQEFRETGNTIYCGNARFQVLSPYTVRMEYSPDGNSSMRRPPSCQERATQRPEFMQALNPGWQACDQDETVLRARLRARRDRLSRPRRCK